MIDNDAAAAASQQQAPKTPAPAKIVVTSSVTVDFPELGWAIAAGEERELPASEAAQEIILASNYISIK